jgi:CRISPR/Cas system CMR subunit Cmr4 (Cas7 group RAMP superfamily)
MNTLTLCFDSDWHIGEGTGQPGYIDRRVRRHPKDGLPYVPAKTISGSQPCSATNRTGGRTTRCLPTPPGW